MILVIFYVIWSNFKRRLEKEIEDALEVAMNIKQANMTLTTQVCKKSEDIFQKFLTVYSIHIVDNTDPQDKKLLVLTVIIVDI